MNKVATPHGEVSVAFDGPDDADVLIVLGHGAGADMNSPFMRAIAAGLSAGGASVCRFNFVYTEQRRKSPDRQPILEATFAAVADTVRERAPRLVLGGKSLGGRIASHVVASGTRVDALVFLGYPLHPPGRPERLRAAHLHDVGVPMLFVEGTRDPFCPLETLEKVRADLTAPTTVAVIDDGDHSLKLRASSGRSTQDAWVEVVEATLDFLNAVTRHR